MPRFIYHTIAPALALALLAACDEVDSDNRYIEMPVIEVKKAVLVEDFTGQECTNCPKAHTVIESLQEQYGDAFIPVSIHAGVQSLSITSTRRLGLATTLGNLYDATAGIGPYGYPSIVIDYNFGTVYAGTAADWVDACRQAMQQDAVMQIECSARYEQTPDGVGTIAVTTNLTSSIDWTGNLQLWIIEDNIVAPQKGVNDNAGWTADYVHNNVLRAAANGDWGQTVTLERGIAATFETSYPITTEWEGTWDIANLRIVAFCYTDADGVVQAARTPVTQ